MIHGYLIRTDKQLKQTNGTLLLFKGSDRVFECYTLELPWCNNKKNISCIPVGTYKLRYYKSPSKGDVYLFEYVIDRTFVEMHAGNYFFDILGCVLVGSGLRDINSDGYKDVTNSKNTMNKLFEVTKKEDILLTII